MTLRERLRPTPATFLSILALVVATGGTSYAAATINTRDLADDAVTSAKIKDGAVRTQDIRDGAIRIGDIAPGVIPTLPGEPRWLLVNAAGEIEQQSGGFTITTAYPTLPEPNPLRANGNVYIDAGEDLTDNGIMAVVALQNTVDQNGDMVMNGRGVGPDANPEFSGEIAVSQCGLAGTVCAPPGTGNTNHLVVSPRLSDGSPTTDGNRKRFYVFITAS